MAPRSRCNFGLLILAVMLSAEARATTCSGQSGPTRALLVELYTSEGCNSCPPADRWLSGLRQERIDPVVALAFHVDYWDYLGWADPFANRDHARRQREAGMRNRLATIYTPQVLVNGRDFPQWRHAGTLTGAAQGNLPPKADLRLNWSADGRGLAWDAEALLRGGGSANEAAAYVAIVEHNLSSEVRAGENRGERLHHDFVVRALLGPYAFDGKGALRLRHALPARPEWKRADLALAMFVQARTSGEVLQALMVPACAAAR